MKRLSPTLLLLLLAGTAWADAPDIKAGVPLQAAGSNIDLSYDTNPTMVDWNNDGLKDLLVGEFTGGYITLYLNGGTDINPVFNFGTKVQSGGIAITVSYG
jgi:hypothetical protein